MYDDDVSKRFVCVYLVRAVRKTRTPEINIVYEFRVDVRNVVSLSRTKRITSTTPARDRQTAESAAAAAAANRHVRVRTQTRPEQMNSDINKAKAKKRFALKKATEREHSSLTMSETMLL